MKPRLQGNLAFFLNPIKGFLKLATLYVNRSELKVDRANVSSRHRSLHSL